jgi:hypothetical protein
MRWHAALQIYNDNIHDLLAQHDHRGKANLKLREDNRGRAYVDNLTEVGGWRHWLTRSYMSTGCSSMCAAIICMPRVSTHHHMARR